MFFFNLQINVFNIYALDKAHFGGHLVHSDNEVVVCCAHDTAMLYDRFCKFFFSLRQAAVHGGLAPVAPDKLRPYLSFFSSPRFPPFFFLLLLHQIDEVYIRCSLFTAMCTMGLYLSRSIHDVYDTLENRSFQRLLKPRCYSVSSVKKDSRCYFSAMRLKRGGTPIQKVGVPPESYAYDQQRC